MERPRHLEHPHDELHHPIIGNAIMGTHCENTHVINELQHPIYVDGLKNVIVAACPDGILVCSKEHSEEIKKAVENLTPRLMYEERRGEPIVYSMTLPTKADSILLPRVSHSTQGRIFPTRSITIVLRYGLS